MKIIKPGVVPETHNEKAHCGVCSCVYLFGKQDCTYGKGYNEYFYKVNCPMPGCHGTTLRHHTAFDNDG